MSFVETFVFDVAKKIFRQRKTKRVKSKANNSKEFPPKLLLNKII